MTTPLSPAALALLLLINIFYFRGLSNWPFIK
jgi:hypothetical protein